MKPACQKFLIINLLVILSCLHSFNTSAAAAAGGYIKYTALGSNQYMVTFVLYNACDSTAPTSVTLTVSSASCSQSLFNTMNMVPGNPPIISECPNKPNTCNGGTAIAFMQFEYSAVVALPSQCSDWTFSINECCRFSGINTLQNPSSKNLYLEATLNNSIQDNSSSEINNFSFYSCAGQLNNLPLSAIDSDGDSLVYSFTDPLSGSNSPIPFTGSHSNTNPITSSTIITLDPITGNIAFTPTDTSETGIVAIQISEYRSGILIGYTMVNLLMIPFICPHPSTISTSMPFAFSIDADESFCFSVLTMDQDTGDTVSLNWNNGISTATFNVTGNYRPVGEFCWTPADSDTIGTHSFILTVQDNGCVSGISYFSFTITVTPYDQIKNLTENNLRFFPNPTTGEFIIKENSGLKISEIVIRSIDGKIINRSKFENPIINLGKYENGVYLIDANLKDGKTIRGKIIKN